MSESTQRGKIILGFIVFCIILQMLGIYDFNKLFGETVEKTIKLVKNQDKKDAEAKAASDKADAIKAAAAKAAAEKIYAINNAIIADKIKKEKADSDAAHQMLTKAYESGDTQAISVAQTQAQTADINLESSIRNAVSEQKAEGQATQDENARQQMQYIKEQQDLANSRITRVNYSAAMNYLNPGDIWQPNNTYNSSIMGKPAKHFNTVNDAADECDSFPECTSVSCDDATMNCSLNKMPTDVYDTTSNDYGGYTTYSK